MTKASAIPVREREADPYATHEDFHTIFNDGIKELYQLALLLTREPEKAEQVLVNGLEDCVTGNRVFRDWARSWAKRTIIQNAIRGLKPRPSQSNSSWSRGTSQVEVIFPLASALTVQGWCAALVSLSPFVSRCNTCSVTVSPGVKPVPVMITVVPGG